MSELAERRIAEPAPTATLPVVGPRASIARLKTLAGSTFGKGIFRAYRIRIAIQIYFALVSLFIGFQFARFVRAAEAGSEPLPVRPPGVEGYLPISGLMGLVDWVRAGELNTIHPAATVLFLIFMGLSLLLRRSFCSWICPVGLLSESLARAGRWFFGRNFRPVRWVDIALRSLKYLLLAFFLYSIFTMSAQALSAFIHSPYNTISDIKMLLFFERIGTFGLGVILFLAVASLFVNGAWCRYLCPYGALAGILSWISPTRVRREEGACIDCRRCDQVCPARLNVSRASGLSNPECTGCLDCLATCPAPGALRAESLGRRLSPVLFAAALVSLAAAGYAAARLTGNWDNRISDSEYIRHVGTMNSPVYSHPGAEVMGVPQEEQSDERVDQ